MFTHMVSTSTPLMFLISAVNDAEPHQRSIWLRRRRIIPVITCDEQMQNRCALLLAQVLHSRGVQVCLAMPDNSGAICLRLLTSSVLQRKATKRSVKEVTGPKGNIEREKTEKGDLKESNYVYPSAAFTGN